MKSASDPSEMLNADETQEQAPGLESPNEDATSPESELVEPDQAESAEAADTEVEPPTPDGADLEAKREADEPADAEDREADAEDTPPERESEPAQDAPDPTEPIAQREDQTPSPAQSEPSEERADSESLEKAFEQALEARREDDDEAGNESPEKISIPGPEPTEPETADHARTGGAPGPPPRAQAIAGPRPQRLAEAQSAESIQSEAEQWESAFRESIALEKRSQVSPRSMATSPLGVFFGLFVVWGVLYLIAIAQNISSHEIKLGTDAESGKWRSPNYLRALDVREKGMLPGEIPSSRISPRRLARFLLERAGFSVSEADLERVSDSPRAIHLGSHPLYYLLHRVIGDPEVGFLFRKTEATLFRQTLEAWPPEGKVTALDWSADVTLTADPAVIFPAARSDLWVLLSIQPPAPGFAPAETRVNVEVWREGRRLLSGEGRMDRQEATTVKMVAGASVEVTIEPLPTPTENPGTENAPYRVRIHLEPDGGPPSGIDEVISKDG